ncbi:uncharacterized protein Dwil_GK18604 [Drosophila willistoni]|uniref:Uncharacterized protein n=1 Tax=Drosophila willistoni TaxID=7260 RepID=A0A0Q9WU15_DROWI|nr:uncharacterized protein Dwil_GK18604 [Drosophila willistoni]
MECALSESPAPALASRTLRPALLLTYGCDLTKQTTREAPMPPLTLSLIPLKLIPYLLPTHKWPEAAQSCLSYHYYAAH